MKSRLHNTGPIGLDIGARAIRAVQLKRTRGGFTLVGHAQVEVSPTDIENNDRLFDDVKLILAERCFSGREVAICIPDRSLEIKNMRLPQMPETELAEAANFEARERFANLRNGYTIRALPAGLVGTDANAQQELIVLAAADEQVEARLKMMMNLGVQVTCIEPSATAFFRPYEQFLRRSSDANVPNAFVDIGEWNTRILISTGDEIAFLKVCPVGGHHLDTAIAKDLVLPPHEATQSRLALINAVENDTDPKFEATANAIRPAVEQLAKEIGLCLRYHSVTFRSERPDHVTISGDAANPIVAKIASEGLQVPVVVGKAFSAASCESAFDDGAVRTGLPQWTTALGLAMHDRRVAHAQKAVQAQQVAS